MAHNGICTQIVYSMAVAPSQPERLYLDVKDIPCIYATYDSAENWQMIDNPSSCSNEISDLLIHSQTPDLVLALEKSG